jgi:hypothetical protein
VELDAPRFEAYLREEGLEQVSKLRADRGQSNTRGRERFSRCAKAILTIGDGPHTGFDRPIGMRLELIPEQDPRDIRSSTPTSYRLLFDGAPLAGVLVRASTLDLPDSRLEARSDASGRVAFTLDRSGVWRLNAVHMLELPNGGEHDPEHDWESLWASLVFAVPTAAPGAAASTGTPPAATPAEISPARPIGSGASSGPNSGAGSVHDSGPDSASRPATSPVPSSALHSGAT